MDDAPDLNDLAELARATSEFVGFSDLELSKEVHLRMRGEALRTLPSHNWTAWIRRAVAELDRRMNRS